MKTFSKDYTEFDKAKTPIGEFVLFKNKFDG